ncbi:hypothetical protein [Polaromonas glacialis]|uniref:hypothetical protein n=1 Tax=Polaromonas glacialis TaxID=866564 RepID=UPI0012EBE889|nr:hypothetical protein [Polaromonas glacialis]
MGNENLIVCGLFYDIEKITCCFASEKHYVRIEYNCVVLGPYDELHIRHTPGATSSSSTRNTRARLLDKRCTTLNNVYEIEPEVKNLCAEELQRIRHARSKPLADALHQKIVLQRSLTLDGSATVKALD